MDLLVLEELVIVLAASVLIIYLSHKLRLPSVVGFLLTGVLVGPGGLSLVKNSETVNILADRGEESFTSPGAEFELREQDTLILVASHRDIDRAFRYLTIGESDKPVSSSGGA